MANVREKEGERKKIVKELSFKQRWLGASILPAGLFTAANNNKMDGQKTESGKEDIEALKDQVSALEKQLKEVHEEDSKKLESLAVDKDQIEQLNARVAVLDSEGEVLKTQLLKAFADVKEMQQQTLDRQAENSALIVFYQKLLADNKKMGRSNVFEVAQQKTESGKDEIEALKDQVSALEKQLKEVHEEDSEKSERDQVVGAAEKKNEELLQKLAKFEKDMAVGAQAAAEAKAAAETKSKAEAEAEAAAEDAPFTDNSCMAGREGSDKREKFKSDVAEDLASASGLPPANFRIKDVSPGSIILDMEVMPDPLAPRTHMLAVKALAEQVVDPSSKLRSGKITSHATGVEVIPPKSREVPAAKSENDEKELANMKTENGVLKAQLEKALADVKDWQQQTVDRQVEIAVLKKEVSGLEKKIRELSKGEDEIREQISATRAALEASKAETASAKAALEPKDAQVDELKRRLAAMEEELGKMRDVKKETTNELEALHKNAAALIKQLQEAEFARKKIVQRSEVEFEERLSDICAPKDAQIDELNKRLAAREEELKKPLDVDKETANELEALRKTGAAKSAEIEDLKKRMSESEALNKKIDAEMQAKDSRVAEALTQVKAAEKELEVKYAEVEEFKVRTAEFEDDKQILNVNINFLEHEVQRLREQIEALEKLLANATQESEALMNKLTLADSEFARTLQVISEQHDELQKPTNGTERAIELAKFLRDEVAGSSFANRKSISTASGGTTVGISFNTMNACVIACMEGGPAFNSKQVHQNDVIIAIDGQEVKGPEILGLLIGNDKPGSVVELTLKRESGEQKKVKLQRMAKSLVADRTKMFELFTRILDRSQKAKDSELVKDVHEATDFWTLMMLEDHEHDQICIYNMCNMQDACHVWLDELLFILEGKEKLQQPIESAPPVPPSPPPPTPPRPPPPRPSPAAPAPAGLDKNFAKTAEKVQDAPPKRESLGYMLDEDYLIALVEADLDEDDQVALALSETYPTT